MRKQFFYQMNMTGWNVIGDTLIEGLVDHDHDQEVLVDHDQKVPVDHDQKVLVGQDQHALLQLALLQLALLQQVLVLLQLVLQEHSQMVQGNSRVGNMDIITIIIIESINVTLMKPPTIQKEE